MTMIGRAALTSGADLGLLLAQARYRRGWSQAKLARLLGVSASLIALVERGERNMTPRLAAEAIRATGDIALACACRELCPLCRVLRIREGDKAQGAA